MAARSSALQSNASSTINRTGLPFGPPTPPPGQPPVLANVLSSQPTVMVAPGQPGPLLCNLHPKQFKRQYCVWNGDKNTLVRFVRRWKNTLTAEWSPAVVSAFLGNSHPSQSDAAMKAHAYCELFVMTHIDTVGNDAQKLHEKISRARETGKLITGNAIELLKWLHQYIIIIDEEEQKRAREALTSIKLLPTMDLAALENVFWWASNIVARLPNSARTAECNVQNCMLKGMTGDLKSRKISLEGQLGTYRLVGNAITDEIFIKALGLALSQHRCEHNIIAGEKFTQPELDSTPQPAPAQPVVNAITDKNNSDKWPCMVCGDRNHRSRDCKITNKCAKCRSIFCGVNFKPPTACISSLVKDDKLPNWNSYQFPDGTALSNYHKIILQDRGKKLQKKPSAPVTNLLEGQLDAQTASALLKQLRAVDATSGATQLTLMIFDAPNATDHLPYLQIASHHHAVRSSDDPWFQGYHYPATPLYMAILGRSYLIPSKPPPKNTVRLLIDSGSTCNVISDVSNMLVSNARKPQHNSIGVGNPDTPLLCTKECDLDLIAISGDGSDTSSDLALPSSEFLIAPNIAQNVVSVSLFLDQHGITFDIAAMLVRTMLGNTAHIYRYGALFYILVRTTTTPHHVMAIVSNRNARHTLLWNARLGGIDTGQARKLHAVTNGMEAGIDDNDAAIIEKCTLDSTAIDLCGLRELTRMRTPSLPGPTDAEKLAEAPGQRLVIDGWPLPHKQVNTKHDYLMLGVCEATGLGAVRSTITHTAKDWVYFIDLTRAAHKALWPKANMISVRSDGAGEFNNEEEFVKPLAARTIKAEKSASRHHFEVGKASAMQLEIAKISNHQMQRVGRNGTFLVHSIKYANKLRNSRPLRGKDETTRMQLFTGKPTDISRLRVWGVDAYALVEKEARQHLAPGTVSVHGIFVNMDGDTWIVFAEGREWPTRHCHFFESLWICEGLPPKQLLISASTQTESAESNGETANATAQAAPAPFARGLGAHATRSRQPSALMLFASAPIANSIAMPPTFVDALEFNGFEQACQDNEYITSTVYTITDGYTLAQPPPHVLMSIPTITLQGPQGPYNMPNPGTPKAARNTPQAAQWEQVIQSHITQVENAGATKVPISWARARLSPGDKIHPSLLRLRVKPDPDTGYLLKLQARGCLDGRTWNTTEPKVSNNLPPEAIRIIVAEAALQRRIIVRGDVPNAYPKSEWPDPAIYHFMHMYPDYQTYTADGELEVYWLESPLYGAPPSGNCWEKKCYATIEKCGAVRSLNVEGLAHLHTSSQTIRFGTIVDDILISSPRDQEQLTRKSMAQFDSDFGEIKWDFDPVEFGFNGAFYVRDIPRGVVSITVTIKIEAACSHHAPAVVGSTDKPKQVTTQAHLDALYLTPMDQRQKLSTAQKQVSSATGALIWFMEYFVAIIHPTHALACVMAYPPAVEGAVVVHDIFKYLWCHRDLSNTFGGQLDTQPVEAMVTYTPLDSTPHADRLIISDASWTGSEVRSLKAHMVKWLGGDVTHRLSTIHAIMPSSFSSEADALHDALEASEYVSAALLEFGLITPSAAVSLLDNRGLVDTLKEQAKGGSKLQRRKLGIIFEHMRAHKFVTKHVDTEQMPVDFMTKLVNAKKLAKSVAYAYNTANAVFKGVHYNDNSAVVVAANKNSGV